MPRCRARSARARCGTVGASACCGSTSSRASCTSWTSTAGTDRHATLGPTIGAVALRRDGGLVLARNHGFSTLDGDLDRAEQSLTELAGVSVDRDGIRFNDAKCDPAGRLWGGTMAMDMSGPFGALYRLDPDATVHVMRPGVTVSNGLGWSPDDTRMYYIDSLAGGIDTYRYDRDTGEISEQRRFVDISSDLGEPDGLTVDATGAVWVAVWRGGVVHRYTPAGELDTIVHLPATLTTCPCFGGADLDTLYITTAHCDLTPEARDAQPLAGGVFACRPGVGGLASTPFAG